MLFWPSPQLQQWHRLCSWCGWPCCSATCVPASQADQKRTASAQPFASGFTHFLQICGNGLGDIEQKRHQGFIPSGRSDHDGILRKERRTSHGGACETPVAARICHKQVKELCPFLPVNNLSGSASGLIQHECDAISSQARSVQLSPAVHHASQSGDSSVCD